MGTNRSPERETRFLLAVPERRVLRAIAGRLPGRVLPDHLTLLGAVSAVATAAAYALSNASTAWLWVASGLLVAHWLGDSLDGTLARVRQVERPRYGYYLDHLVDACSTAAIGIGLGLSPFMALWAGALVAVAYLILSINVYLESQVFGRFALGYGRIGPTEVRIMLIGLNTLLALGIDPHVVIAGRPLAALDLVALIASAVMLVMLTGRARSALRALAAQEPAAPRHPVVRSRIGCSVRFIRIAVATGAAFLAVALSIPSGFTDAGAAASNTDGMLAYACFRPITGGSTSHICVAGSDGRGEHIIDAVSTPPSDRFSVGPRWSPDGTQILYLCDWDTTNRFDFPMRDVVAFGPVGFARNSGGEVCVVPADGGGPRVLTHTADHANAPTWSPDGRTIAFSVSASPIVVGGNGPAAPGPGIYVVPADGSSVPRQITKGFGDDMPAWSRDGKQLAFAAQSEDMLGIAAVSIETGARRLLVDAGRARKLLAPAWSPDGTHIAFTAYPTDTRETWVVRSDGKKAVRLLATDRLEPNYGLAFTPVWEPDGRAVISIVVSDAQAQLVASPNTGGRARPLTHIPASEKAWGAFTPSIAPDGKTVAFVDDRIDGSKMLHELFEMSISGRDERVVRLDGRIGEPLANSELDPSWRPVHR